MKLGLERTGYCAWETRMQTPTTGARKDAITHYMLIRSPGLGLELCGNLDNL